MVKESVDNKSQEEENPILMNGLEMRREGNPWAAAGLTQKSLSVLKRRT